MLVRAVGFTQVPEADAPDSGYTIYGVIDVNPRDGHLRVFERRVSADDPRVAAAVALGEAIQAQRAGR